MEDPYVTRPLPVGEPSSAGTRFRILRPYARGGLGEVYVALDEELHREVALKEIQQQRADQPESRARFLLEAEVTGGLEHPGIVPVYGLGAYPDGRPFYAMRFIRGDSLEEAIERFHAADASSRDPGERSVQLHQLLGRFVDVCDALEYAHSRGVLHRDLKPGNIMLGKYGETLVVDWGLAKVVGREETPAGKEAPPLQPVSASGSAPTAAGQVLGTPQYMSPEQAEGRLDELGPASDVYSLGATLYTLLTGKAPFDAAELGALLRRVAQGDFPPPRSVNRSVPPPLQAICLKAMALRPADRYASPRALADDIEHWLADEPVGVWQEPWHARLWRWSKRHRTALTGAGAALAVTAVGLGAATLVLGEKNRQLQAANQRAEANFAEAHAAVRDMLRQAEENPWLQGPGMHKAQESLLRTALKYYREFLSRRATDPQLRTELAQARIAIAGITREIGSPAEARREYQAARDALSSLVEQTPHDARLLGQAALVDSRIAQLDQELGEVDANRKDFQRAMTSYRRLLQERPEDDSLKLDFAAACFLQGESVNDLLLLAEARRAAEAVEAQSVPVQRESAVLQARILNQIGLIESNAGQLDRASAAFHRAQELLVGLGEDAADEPALDALRGALALNQGRLVRKQGDLAGAQLQFAAAQKRFEKLASRDPDIYEYQLRLATAHLELGKLALAAEDADRARSAFAAARARLSSLGEVRSRVLDRFELARSCLDLSGALLRTGEAEQARELLAESRRTLEALIALDPKQPDYHRNLAAVWNQAAGMEQRRGDLSACAAALDKALHELEPIAAAHPDRPEFRNALAKVYSNLGSVQASQGAWKEAWKRQRQARQIYDDEVRRHPDIAEFTADRDDFLRRFAMQAVARLGQLGDEPAEVQERRELHVETVDVLADLKRRDRLPAELVDDLAELEQQLQTLGDAKPRSLDQQ
ncbi:MAG TPA: protein kinase [Pirellulales bacterium]|nr:protein kinase [Pirellulales bacterium]